MVSGIVRPPALDLANRDLLRPICTRFGWRNQRKSFSADIPHVLDLTIQLFRCRTILRSLCRSGSDSRAATSMRRILDGIEAELTVAAAPWATDRDAFADATAAAAAARFSEAFGRWRQLYLAHEHS